MSKMTREQRITIGDEAGRMLEESSIFNKVLNALVADYITDLMKTRPGSEEGLIAHASLSVLNDVKQRLRALQNDATMARKESQ